MDIPPKTLKHQLRGQDGPLAEGAEGMPPPGVGETALTRSRRRRLARRQPAAIARLPGSLPVLQAFQDFLDAERRRARNRMLAIMSLFIVVLLAVVGAGGFFAYSHFEHLSESFEEVRTDVGTFRSESLDAQEKARSLLSRITERAERIGQQLSEEQIRREMATATVEAKIEHYAGQLHRLRELFGSLNEENSFLRDDLAELKAGMTPPPSNIESVVAEMAALPDVEPTQTRATDELEPQVEKPPAVLVMSITPRGQDQAFSWRVPIPE